MKLFWSFVILAPLFIASCRNSTPPQIVICIGDGVGGADCDIPGVGKEYWPPSRLANAWITTQEDMAKFASWCYSTNVKTTEVILEKMRQDIQGPARGSQP